MNNPEQAYKYADLILKYLKGNLDTGEEAILKKWLDSDIRNRKFLETLSNEKDIEKEFELFLTLNPLNAWSNIVAGKNKQKRSYPDVWKYAAAVIILLCSASLLYYLNTPRSKQPLLAANKVKRTQDIKPGGDKAKLTLADGSVIMLEDANNGLITMHSGVKISKQNGRVLYEVLAAANAEAPVSFNTISTPRGGQYQVLLPDGSKVWLNASSSLNYPTSFNGAERVVKLTGEAYFEISKDPGKPFKVLAGKAEVQVLGTHFNVMAYPDEKEVNTTLLEGSVKISAASKSLMMIPGQEGRIGSDGNIKIAQADADEAIAWKEGAFMFKNEDIQMVMRQVGRWYDVDISYEGNIPEGHYSGKISRNNNVSKILNMLELTGGVHFKIEDKKINVYK